MEPRGETRELEWSGRLGPLVWPWVGVLAFFAVFFAIAVGDKSAGRNDWAARAIAAAVPAIFLGPLCVLVITMSPRWVRASVHELVVRQWVGGTRTVTASDIEGIRLLRRNSSVTHVVVRRRGGKLMRLLAPPEWGRETGFAEGLVSLYGKDPDVAELEASAGSSKVVEMATGSVVFRAKHRARMIVWAEWVALVLTMAFVLSAWPLVQFLESADAPRWFSEAGFLVVFPAVVIACVGLLKVFDLLRGGDVKAVVVSDRGVEIEKQWRRTLYPASRITGVDYWLSSQRASMLPSVYLDGGFGRRLAIPERRFEAGGGELTGVLLHRFGQRLPKKR